MEEKLATEIIREVKAHGKRWFVIAIIELFIIFSMSIAIVNFLNQPTEETITYTQDADSSDNSSINQRIGE